MSWDELKTRVEAWISRDLDEGDRAELNALLERGQSGDDDARAELGERFAGPLTFGTAGLRGLLGAGETRMNRAVVVRTTYGLGATLLAQDPAAARERGVVIGYDGRRGSRVFAEDAAGVLASQGIRVHLTQDVCPTPVLAYAVLRCRAAAGIMVTASHNPPEYNGYKVYAANGAQIVPPLDRAIAEAIDAAPSAREIERLSLEEARGKDLVSDLGDAHDRAYLDAVRRLSLSDGGDRSLGIVYTAMHGVGNKLVLAALSEAGFTDVHSVPEQAQPDGAFPTVRFPNPEEPGAMDLSLALARQVDAALILANDPDADRLAAIVRTGPDEYTPLTGNEIGVLLGHALLTLGSQEAGSDRLVAASIVSSPQLGVIAKALGVRYAETLTGFKWIANRALELEPEGARFVFGYEEALGYTVGTLVRDKDGVSAAMVLAELAAIHHAEGRTLIDALEAIAEGSGLYVSGQRSTVFPGSEGQAKMAKIMEGLRTSPPETLGEQAVLAVRDYQTGVRTARDGSTQPVDLPPSNVLVFELEGGDRVIARPSGTEPKIKFYFDVVSALEGERYAQAKVRVRARMEALADAFTARVAGA